MPLVESGSNEARGENIAREIKAGKDPKQAEAIAYNVQRHLDEPMQIEHQQDTGAGIQTNTVDAGEVMPAGPSLSAIAKRNAEFWEPQWGPVDAGVGEGPEANPVRNV
jgi:hypothetical protein